MRFEAKLAYRHLVSGGGQTLLTVAAVAIAVTVIIFINTLITGVQQRILKDLLGQLAHINIKAPNPAPKTLSDVMSKTEAPSGNAPFFSTDRQKQVQQRNDIENWQATEKNLAQFPGVRVVASAVRGNAFLIAGSKRLGITVSGADPISEEKIVGLQANMIAGNWLGIGPEDVVIGWRLAEEAGVQLGDRVRLESSQGVSAIYRVAGIFDTGNNNVDLSQAFMTLRSAQSLFAMKQDVSVIQLKLNDPFQANIISDQISATMPYKVDSWMREQAFIVNAFQSQDSTRLMICAFALLASAFGIASVLIVSVIQKSKQIGILKSMGAKDRQILIVFTLEGLGIALVGCLLGCLIGYGLLKLLEGIPQAARFGKVDKLFTIIYDPAIFGGACAAAIIATLLASWLPAQRAARMNPVDVIRGG